MLPACLPALSYVTYLVARPFVAMRVSMSLLDDNLWGCINCGAGAKNEKQSDEVTRRAGERLLPMKVDILRYETCEQLEPALDEDSKKDDVETTNVTQRSIPVTGEYGRRFCVTLHRHVVV